MPQNIIRHDRRIEPGASAGCYIQAINGIELGKNMLIGPGVMLISANHDVNDFIQHDPSGPIIIEDNCWIGSHAIILPGVRLSPHTIVAAGAVVTNNFPPNCVVGGIPARIIRTISDYDQGV